jgi:hypothetical protein
MPRRLIACSLAVQFLWVGCCAAQTADPGPVRVGDRWSYNVNDSLTGDPRPAITIVVGEINDKSITTRVTLQGRDRPVTAVFDPDWGRIDDGAWRLRPSGIGIKKPLQIGKEWKSDASAVSLQSGIVARATGAAKVVGREQVTTPAGTYDTFRIDMTVRMINSNDQTRSQTWTFVLWYAPAVNRWVKRTAEWRFEGQLRDSFVEELTDFSRRP